MMKIMSKAAHVRTTTRNRNMRPTAVRMPGEQTALHRCGG